MTALCGGGTSQVKPNIPGAELVTASAVASILQRYGMPWIATYTVALGVLQFSTATFCGTDPPTVPTIVASDLVDILGVNGTVAQLAAVQKFTQLVGAYVWYDWCQCTSGTTPSAPPAVQPPSGVPALPAPVSTGSCPPMSMSQVLSQPSPATFATGDITPSLVPYTTTTTVTRGGLPLTLYSMPNPAPSQLVVTSTNHHTATLVDGVELDVYFYSAALAQTGTFVARAAANQDTIQTTINIPSTSAWIAIQQTGGNVPYTSNGPVSITAQYIGNCGFGGTACCTPPTDPTLINTLQQILQMVTLVQRQAAPFAYILGTPHPGLTGSGEIAVQGILGALASVTARGSAVGAQAGDPLTLWQAGWLRLGTADGWLARRPIDADAVLELVPDAGVLTRVGYSASPGVTLTITPVIREA